jgi:cobalt transporter subunit CbtA
MIWAAVLAGLVAGLVSAGLIEWRIAPLIASAETYEEAAPHTHEAGAPAHDHAAMPQGAARIALTGLSTVLATIGFALLLGGAALVLDLPLTLRTGPLWGLGAFVAVQVMPALVLPLQLPGMAALDLGTRQTLWLGIATLAGAGLLLVARLRSTPLRLAGLALALSPLLIPVALPEGGGVVPPELASAFAANSLALGALSFAVLGTALGYFSTWRRAP